MENKKNIRTGKWKCGQYEQHRLLEQGEQI